MGLVQFVGWLVRFAVCGVRSSLAGVGSTAQVCRVSTCGRAPLINIRVFQRLYMSRPTRGSAPVLGGHDGAGQHHLGRVSRSLANCGCWLGGLVGRAIA